MFPLRRISGFFLRCLVIYALLLAPWPGLLDGYRAFFAAGGNVLFHWFGPSGSVSFTPIPSPDHVKDMSIELTKLRPQRVRGTMQIKCAYAGYRPTAFLIALVLATPIPWRRRLWALAWGLALVNAFVAFRVGLKLVDVFSHPGHPLAIFTLSQHVKIGVRMMVLLFYRAPEMHYIVPAFVWLLATFRRDDLKSVLTRCPGKGETPAEA